MNERTQRLILAGSAVLDRAADIIFPPRCPLCERLLIGREKYVCIDCAGKLPLIRQPFCFRCGRPLEDAGKEYCFHCERTGWYFDEGRCTFIYAGALKEALLRMKFKNHRDYIPFFAASMAYAHRDFLEKQKPDMIIPVPLHKRKERERGFDQCALIGKQISQITQIPLRRDILIRNRYTSAQKGLLPAQRMKNLAGAFSVRQGCLPPKARILLVDDLLTTGSTVNECARVLKENGAGKVWFLALAAPEI